MAFLTTMNIIASGFTAQQIRLDVISENVTNINTTRTESGGAYRRKVVVFQSESDKNSFRAAMARAARRGQAVSSRRISVAGGVRVVEIAEDESTMPMVYDPEHPDSNEDGYLELPNVTLVKEVTDAMAASQAYNADITMFNMMKQVVAQGLQIGA